MVAKWNWLSPYVGAQLPWHNTLYVCESTYSFMESKQLTCHDSLNGKKYAWPVNFLNHATCNPLSLSIGLCPYSDHYYVSAPLPSLNLPKYSHYKLLLEFAQEALCIYRRAISGFFKSVGRMHTRSPHMLCFSEQLSGSKKQSDAMA